MRVRPTRVRRLRTRRAIGRVALVGVIAGLGAGYLMARGPASESQEGSTTVRSMDLGVGGILRSQAVSLGYRGLVAPPVSQLVDWVVAPVDPYGTGGRLMATTGVGDSVMEGAAAAHELLATWYVEDWLSAEYKVGLTQAMAAVVVVEGKDHDVVTNATTVGELLSAMGIEPDRDDRVLPSPGSPLLQGATVRYDSIEFRTRDVRLPIPFTTVTRYSDDLEPGEVRLVRAGVHGLMIETQRVKVVNGKVVATTVLDRRVVTEAIPARRIAGRLSASSGTQVGEASWYSFAPGNGYTAAHPWLPFGTVVTVRNLANGRTVEVVINDRGPFGGRVIDLSSEAFAQIAPLGQGVCQVRLTW